MGTINVKIQLRSDISANWAMNNPTLLIGEVGVATDLLLFKLGNGTNSWNDLNYQQGVYTSLINNAPENSIAIVGGKIYIYDTEWGLVTSGVSSINGQTGDVVIPNATLNAAGLMPALDKSKLDGIEEGANNYTLPVPTSTTIGGVKAGTNITIDEDGTINSIGDSASVGIARGSFEFNDNTYQYTYNTLIGYNPKNYEVDIIVDSTEMSIPIPMLIYYLAELADGAITLSISDDDLFSIWFWGEISLCIDDITINTYVSFETTTTDFEVTLPNIGTILTHNADTGELTIKDTTIVATVDDLTSTATTAALSANQGRVLDEKKVDKEEGKGLSSNDYTDAEKEKLGNLSESVGTIAMELQDGDLVVVTEALENTTFSLDSDGVLFIEL